MDITRQAIPRKYMTRLHFIDFHPFEYLKTLTKKTVTTTKHQGGFYVNTIWKLQACGLDFFDML
jgi:hypothetical protein